MKKINTGVLRDMVRDQAALGTHWIPLPALLARLDLLESLEDARSRVRDARSAIERGDPDWAEVQLELVEASLVWLLADR